MRVNMHMHDVQTRVVCGCTRTQMHTSMGACVLCTCVGAGGERVRARERERPTYPHACKHNRPHTNTLHTYILNRERAHTHTNTHTHTHLPPPNHAHALSHRGKTMDGTSCLTTFEVCVCCVGGWAWGVPLYNMHTNQKHVKIHASIHPSIHPAIHGKIQHQLYACMHAYKIQCLLHVCIHHT